MCRSPTVKLTFHDRTRLFTLFEVRKCFTQVKSCIAHHLNNSIISTPIHLKQMDLISVEIMSYCHFGNTNFDIRCSSKLLLYDPHYMLYIRTIQFTLNESVMYTILLNTDDFNAKNLILQ